MKFPITNRWILDTTPEISFTGVFYFYKKYGIIIIAVKMSRYYDH